jgi:hypothetical protein
MSERNFRLMWSKKWWDFPKFEEQYVSCHESRMIAQSLGRGKLKPENYPKEGDKFIVEYSGKIVARGIVRSNVFIDETLRSFGHSCNRGESPHATETRRNMIEILEIYNDANRVPAVCHGQRTWIRLNN